MSVEYDPTTCFIFWSYAILRRLARHNVDVHRSFKSQIEKKFTPFEKRLVKKISFELF